MSQRRLVVERIAISAPVRSLLAGGHFFNNA